MWKIKLKELLGLRKVHFDLEGNPFVETVSTRKYNKEQFSGFVVKIQEYCARELDLQILSPEEFKEES